MKTTAVDRRWMQRALALADIAAAQNEVPVGAVLVGDGIEYGAGWNAPISHCDPTAHAEIIALRAAAQARGNYRLPNTTLYTTMEPCPMCAGALVHARVSRVVYAAADRQWGAAGSVLNVFTAPGLNHRVEVTAAVLAEPSIARLQAFFAARRLPTRGSPGG